VGCWERDLRRSGERVGLGMDEAVVVLLLLVVFDEEEVES
jgi:hypothetical protein